MSAAHISVINAEESLTPLIRYTNFIFQPNDLVYPDGSATTPGGGVTWTGLEQSFRLKFPDGVVVMGGREGGGLK